MQILYSTNILNQPISLLCPKNLQGNNMNNPFVTITSATFSDNTKLEFSSNDIVVFVGPNNSGKSAALKDIYEKSKASAHEGVVVKGIELTNSGTKEEVLSWLERGAKKMLQNPSNPTYSRLGATVHKSQAEQHWTNNQNGLAQLCPFFVYHLTTESRLHAANPANNIALTKDPLTHPIHYLQFDDQIEIKISNYFKQAFGLDLIVHRNAGNQVPLHCGSRPIPANGEDRVSINYIRELEKLPTLHTQGDGMRSFVGVLCTP